MTIGEGGTAVAKRDTVPFIHLSTERLEAERAFELWRHLVPAYGIEIGVPAREFRIETTGWLLGSFILTTGRIAAMRTVRSGPRLADRYSDLLLVLVCEGSMSGRTAARRLEIGPGRLAMLDAGKPFEMEMTDCGYVMLLLPRESLYGIPEDRLDEAHGNVLDGADADFLADHMRLLARHLPRMTCRDAHGAAQATLKLVEGVVSRKDAQAGRSVPARQSLRRRAERHIDNHLSARDLSPDRIAEALDISRTSLYRAFQASGGVAHHVRTRRLDTARSLLEHPEEHRSLAEIAELLGFATADAFTKAFRHRFGLPPRLMRRTAPSLVVAPGSRQLFDHWVQGIASFADPS